MNEDYYIAKVASFKDIVERVQVYMWWTKKNDAMIAGTIEDDKYCFYNLDANIIDELEYWEVSKILKNYLSQDIQTKLKLGNSCLFYLKFQKR